MVLDVERQINTLFILKGNSQEALSAGADHCQAHGNGSHLGFSILIPFPLAYYSVCGTSYDKTYYVAL